MKKIKCVSTLFLVMTLCSCTNDEPISTGNSTQAGDVRISAKSILGSPQVSKNNPLKPQAKEAKVVNVSNTIVDDLNGLIR